MAGSCFGAALLAPMVLSASAGALASAMTRAAMQGAISASLNRGNILKDALQSVVTAGVANKVQLALHLHQYTLLVNALTATANTAVGNVLHGGKFGQNLLANIVTNQLNMQGYSEILGQVANAIVTGIIKQQTPEQILQAWGLSTIGQISGEYGANLGTQLCQPRQARLKVIPAPDLEVVEKPSVMIKGNKTSDTKLAATPAAIDFGYFTDPRTKNVFS